MQRRWMGIAVGVAALAAASPASAQDVEARPGHDPEKRIERLTEALDLTEAQAVEIRAIFAEQGDERKALREAGDREAVRAHMRETHERMASVLTEEQREKLESLRVHRGDRERHRDGEGMRQHDGEGKRQHEGEERHHPREGAEG